MKDFVLHLEKIAQVGAMPVSPAQVYAAQKAEKEYEGLLKADSPKAYATAITGGILSGLGIPIALNLGSLAAGGGLPKKIQNLHGQAYLKEALTGLYGFKTDDAAQIASAMISQKPIVSRATNNALQLARMKLAKTLADDPLPGVSEDVRKRIVGRARSMVDDVGPQLIYSTAKNPAEAAQMLQVFGSMKPSDKIPAFTQLKGAYRAMSASGHYPTSLGFPGFDGDEISALVGVGAEMYKNRTGKALSDTSTAIKLVSKHIGNSIKAGLPIAVLSAAFAAKRQSDKAKEIRDVRPPEPNPFGEYR